MASEKKLQNLLRYIGKSIRTNVTDENTEKLDDIVHKTKAKKGVGVRFMKSWEREKELIEEGREEGREEMRKEKDKVIAEKDTELEQLREALTRAKAQGFKE